MPAREKPLILVVEDNADNSILTRKILNHYGYEVDVVEEGERALEYCRERTPDLILMDVSLPGMDGLEVTRALRAMEPCREVPIIALTAHAMTGWEARSREAGCDDYLAKPVLPNDLVARVRDHLGD